MPAIVNTEMAKAWDGEEGDRWTAHADRYDTATRRHWRHLMDGALIGADQRVLDIGCGTGKSTREAARLATGGSALGVDLSARMLECARGRAVAEEVANVAFEQGDAQVHPFDEATFDVALSSFGAMFFDDRRAAFANIARALRPGARLALLAWRDLARNEWLLSFRAALAAGRELPVPPAGAPGPFGLADAEGVRAVLEEAGFEQVDLTEVAEPAEFGTDADDAFGFVKTLGIVHGLTQDLDDAATALVLDDTYRMLVDHQTADGVLFGTSAWLVTARRR